MTLRLASLVLLGLLFGCHKQQAAQTEPVAQTNAATAPEPAEQKLVLDPGKVKAFAGYLDKSIDLLPQSKAALAKLSDNVDKKKYEGALGAQNMLQDHVEAGRKLHEADEALRKQYNLSEPEIKAFGEIQAAILVRASPIMKMMTQSIEQTEKSLATVPEAMRAEAEANLAEAKANRDKTLSLKEKRDEYGDAIVDAMLAEEATWLQLDAKRMKVYSN